MKKHQTINDFLSEAIGRHFANALVASDLHQARADTNDKTKCAEVLEDLKYRPAAIAAALGTTSMK